MGEIRRTILLLEDQTFIRTLVAELLERAGFEVSAHATAQSALNAFTAFDPDALVTDIDLGTRPDGAETALILRQRSPHMAVVFLSNFPRAALAPRSASILADAVFVHKSSLTSGSVLVAAVDAALRNIKRPASDSPTPTDDDQDRLSALTRSQWEILRLIAEGLSNAEIARSTGRTIRAVERLIARLFGSLGVSSEDGVNPRVAAANLYSRSFGVPAPRVPE